MAVMKKSVNLQLKMDWLIFDILNETYLKGRTIQNDQNYKEVASMFASEDEENCEKMMRSISTAVDTVREEASEYIDTDDMTSNNTPLAPTDKYISLALSMPSNFNLAASGPIASHMHEYIKNFSVAEWYTVTNKEDAQTYYEKAQISLELMKKALSKRSRPESPRDKS